MRREGPLLRLRRGAFELPTAPSEAALAITADDTYEVFVNGRRAGADASAES